MTIRTFDFGPEDDDFRPPVSPAPQTPTPDDVVATNVEVVLDDGQLPVDIRLSPSYYRTVAPAEHSAALMTGYRSALLRAVERAAQNGTLAALAPPRPHRHRLLAQLATTTAADYQHVALSGRGGASATGMYSDEAGGAAVTVTDDGSTLTRIAVNPVWAAEMGADHVRDEVLRAVGAVRAQRSTAPPADPFPELSDAALESRLVTHVTNLLLQEAHL